MSGLLILLAYGPWIFAPAWIWGPLTGAAVALAAYAVLRGSGPAEGSGQAAMARWINAAVSLIVLALVVYAL